MVWNLKWRGLLYIPCVLCQRAQEKGFKKGFKRLTYVHISTPQLISLSLALTDRAAFEDAPELVIKLTRQKALRIKIKD